MPLRMKGQGKGKVDDFNDVIAQYLAALLQP